MVRVPLEWLDAVDDDGTPAWMQFTSYEEGVDLARDLGWGISQGGWNIEAIAAREASEAAIRGIAPDLLREHACDRMSMALASMGIADTDPGFVAPRPKHASTPQIHRRRPATNSPIEERLLLAIEESFGDALDCGDGFYRFGHWLIETQLPTLGYRLDIAIRSTKCDDKIAVEADGHAYHERTKEQAAHDRRRDRRLTADGWHVLRFTGSEIHHDAAACAYEVVDLMDKLGAGRRS